MTVPLRVIERYTSKEFQLILLLSHGAKYSAVQIADILGVQDGSVKVMMSRLRKMPLLMTVHSEKVHGFDYQQYWITYVTYKKPQINP